MKRQDNLKIWLDAAMEYCQNHTLPICPFCQNAKLTVQEHISEVRDSWTFSCPQCHAFTHLDGVSKNTRPREEVQHRLQQFCDQILHTQLDKQAALEIKRQINEYCLASNVTVEERRVFITTGAGESLETICSMPN